MDPRLILVVGALCEILLAAFLIINSVRIYRKFRHYRRQGRALMDAWEEALAALLPARAARLIMLEPRLYHALVVSFKNSPTDASNGIFATRLESYRLLVFIISGLCGLEILLVAALLPQSLMFWKVLHSAVGLWAILWLLGYYKAMQIYRHQVTDNGIIFRMGVVLHEELNWLDIKGIGRAACSSPGYGPQLSRTESGSMFLAAGNNCNICVELAGEHSFKGLFRPINGIQRLYLSLEQPEEFLRYAQSQAAEHPLVKS